MRSSAASGRPARPFPIALEIGQKSSIVRGRGRFSVPLELAFVWLRPKLPWLHALLFVGFLIVLLVPVALPEAPFTSKLADFSNWLIWGLWFPLVFISVLISGRSWCGMLCPMGAASQWMNNIGLKRPVPGWLRWEGTPIVSFILITILGQTVGVRDYPIALLEVFGGTLMAALLIGFLYGQGRGRRAWCRHACPIGLLLGVFSRLSIVDLVPKRPRKGGDAYTERGMCPTMIDINRKTESRHCIMCMRCVHPQRNGGLTLRLRPPGEEVADIHNHHPSMSEIWFLLLGTGVALGGFLWLVLPEYQTLRQLAGSWAIEHELYWIGNPGPAWLMSVHPEARETFVWLDFILIVGWMLGVMLLFTLLLGMLNSVSTGLAGRLGARGERRQRYIELGYQFAPVAMVSLLLGLGGELFNNLPQQSIIWVKLILLAGAFSWSVALGWRILRNQGLNPVASLLSMIPGITGITLIVAGWWPAVSAV
jgi:hypothetical protein